MKIAVIDQVDISSSNYQEVSKLSNDCVTRQFDNYYLKYQLDQLLPSVTHHLWRFSLFNIWL